MNTKFKVPHAFQQRLSIEKTLILCEVMPSFNAMITRWQQLQNVYPIYHNVIKAGISKLTDYHGHATTVPANILSICKYYRHMTMLKLLTIQTVLNPLMKLDWFKQHMPENVEEVQML